MSRLPCIWTGSRAVVNLLPARFLEGTLGMVGWRDGGGGDPSKIGVRYTGVDCQGAFRQVSLSTWGRETRGFRMERRIFNCGIIGIDPSAHAQGLISCRVHRTRSDIFYKREPDLLLDILERIHHLLIFVPSAHKLQGNRRPFERLRIICRTVSRSVHPIPSPQNIHRLWFSASFSFIGWYSPSAASTSGSTLDTGKTKAG